MKNKYVITISTCILISIAGIKVNAKEQIPVTIPKFNVTINNNKIDRINSKYPPIVYKDITYFPMTYYDMRLLGVETDWKGDIEGLFINKSDISGSYVPIRDERNQKNYYATIPNFPITINDKKIDNLKEEYPLLSFRDVTYFPLTWKYSVGEFGWNYNFNEKSGLVISSNTNITTSENIIDSGSVTINPPYYYFIKDNKLYANQINSNNKSKVIFSPPDESVGFLLSSIDDVTRLTHKLYPATTKSPIYTYILKHENVENLNREEYTDIIFKKGKVYLIQIDYDGFAIKFDNQIRKVVNKKYSLDDFYEFDGLLYLTCFDRENINKRILCSIDNDNNFKIIDEIGNNLSYSIDWRPDFKFIHFNKKENPGYYVQWDKNFLYYIDEDDNSNLSLYKYNLFNNKKEKIQVFKNASSGWQYKILNGNIFTRNDQNNYSLYMNNVAMNEKATLDSFEIFSDYLVAIFSETPENKYRIMVIDQNGNIVYKSADITTIDSISIKDDILYYFNLNSKKIVTAPLK